MDLALGEVGLSKDAALRMTWGDLWRTIYGYWIRQDREWDRTRTLVAMLYNINRGKNRAAKRPQKIMPLAIDHLGRERMEWTEERKDEYKRALEAWDFNLLKRKRGTKQHHHPD